jgi:hypothetical protein
VIGSGKDDDDVPVDDIPNSLPEVMSDVRVVDEFPVVFHRVVVFCAIVWNRNTVEIRIGSVVVWLSCDGRLACCFAR